ncbi:MAG: cohesin domain-containing protein [candidate division Zixibacteria bacterium]
MKKLFLLLIVGTILAAGWSDASAQIYSDQDTMALMDAYGNPGDTVDVYFNMINTTVAVAGVFHRIVYDENILEAVNVECVDRGCEFPLLGSNLTVPGVVQFSMYDLSGEVTIPRGEGPVAKVTFAVSQFVAPGTNILLEFEDDWQSLNGWADSIPENPNLIVPILIPGNFQVGGGPNNMAPVIGNIAGQQVAEGQILQFSVTAHDFDADPITLTALDIPLNATFPQVQGDSMVIGTFVFSPNFDQGPDTVIVTFTATDDHNNVTTRPVQIVILDQPNNIMRVVSNQGGIPGADLRPMNINLFNTSPIYGSQFEILYDPEQIDVWSVNSTYRCTNMWFNSNEPDPGRIIVVIFSVGSDTIAAGDGPLVELVINVNSSASFGQTGIQLIEATEVIDSAGTSKELTAENGYFTVDPFGDANLDGLVTVGDCVSIVAYIIGRLEFSERQFDAADIDSSGWVNIGDLQSIINVILEVVTPRLSYPFDDPLVSVELIKDRVPSGDILDIPLYTVIQEEASAVQFEVSYNANKMTGLEIVKGDIASDMTLDYTISNGGIKGILYNLSGASIGPVSGDLFDIAFRIDSGDFDPDFDIELSEFLVVNPTAGFMPVEIKGRLPESFLLSQNYPNPFNANTNIRFDLPSEGWAELSVYDLLGRKITVLLNEYLPAGSHLVTWDGRAGDGNMMATGVYFYRLKATNFDKTKKMLLMK